MIFLILSSDIETNPGPNIGIADPKTKAYNNGFFSFCNWNLNSLGKNNFERISYLQVENSVYNYDIISLCETSLNQTTQPSANGFKGYNFVSSDHPSGEKKGVWEYFIKRLYP